MATRPYFFAFGSGNPATNTGLSPTFIFFVNTSGATIAPPSITETYVGTGLYLANYQATQTISFVLDGATTGLVATDRYISGVMDPFDLFGTTLISIGNTAIALGQTTVAQITNIGATLTAFGSTQIALGQTTITQLINTGATLTAIGNTQGAYGQTLTANFTNFGSTLVGIGSTQFAFGQSNVAIGTTLTGFANTLLAIGQSSPLFGLIGSTASSFGSTSIDPTTVFGFLMRAQEMAEGNQIYTKSTGILDFFNRGSSTLLREKTISDTSSTTTKT